MAPDRDYYDVLGVERGAAQDDIKRAYRKLAASLHPDRNKALDAAERFKEVTEAYAVLSDPEKRAVYDRYGHAGVHQEWGSGEDLFRGADFSGFGDLGFDLGSLFRNLFGADPFGFGGSRRPRGSDVVVRVQLEPADILAGRRVRVEYERDEACRACAGTGGEGPDAFARCTDCGGSGQIVRQQRTPFGVVRQVGVCGACRGAGATLVSPCKTCKGRGVQRTASGTDLRIPPGVEDGSRLRMRGAGNAVPGGDPGDLIVQVRAPLPGGLKRDGGDLVVSVRVPATVAALGGDVAIPTLDGPAVIQVPAGTQPGDRLLLRGEGVPPVGGGARGALVVEVDVLIPTRLSPEERVAWEQLAKAEGTETAKGPARRLKEKLGEWVRRE